MVLQFLFCGGDAPLACNQFSALGTRHILAIYFLRLVSAMLLQYPFLRLERAIVFQFWFVVFGHEGTASVLIYWEAMQLCAAKQDLVEGREGREEVGT